MSAARQRSSILPMPASLRCLSTWRFRLDARWAEVLPLGRHRARTSAGRLSRGLPPPVRRKLATCRFCLHCFCC